MVFFLATLRPASSTAPTVRMAQIRKFSVGVLESNNFFDQHSKVQGNHRLRICGDGFSTEFLWRVGGSRAAAVPPTLD